VGTQRGRDGDRLGMLPAAAGLVCLLLAWGVRTSIGSAPAAASATARGTVPTASAGARPGAGAPGDAAAGPPGSPSAATAASAGSGPAPSGTPAAPRRAATTVTAPPVVVPAAVDPAAQSTARDHWSPEAMEAAKPVDPAPAVTRPAGAATSTDATSPSGPGPSDTAGTTASSGTGAPAAVTTPPVTTAANTPAATSGAPVTTAATTTSATAEVDAGTAWSRGGLVARVTGRVFFTLGGVDYTCSGSAVDSPDASTVLTAAHCLEDVGGATTRWATRWAFVPGYDDGRAPYGVFVATGLAALGGFAAGDIGQDVALVNVGRNAAGQRLVEAVGGLPMSFGGRAEGALRSFGYPAAAPFDGSRLVSCAGSGRPDPDSPDTGLGCAMTGGASGGPWVAGFDPATGSGRLVSVTSFGYSDAPGTLYGPPLGTAAQQLYDLVAADPAR